MSLYLLDRESGTAIYAQIARQLEKEVADQYAPGDSLPSEGTLAERFGVNRHTLRRAVDELVEMGLLERRHGLGVFVLDAQWDYQIGQATRFTENLASLGLTSESRVLHGQTIEASRSVASRLSITQGDMVHWMETLRSVDQHPVCLISHFLPAKRFPDLPKQFQGGSLHAVLGKQYDCTLRRTESLVTAVLPQGDDARLLAMPQNRPVLRVKSINVDERDDTPVEYAITRFRADRIQLRITP